MDIDLARALKEQNAFLERQAIALENAEILKNLNVTKKR